MNVLTSRQLAVRASLLAVTLIINSISSITLADTSDTSHHSKSNGVQNQQDSADDEHQAGVIRLTAEQITMAGIIVQPLQL